MILSRLLLRRHSVLPGFDLALGFALLYLSLIVLIPLSATFLKTFTLSWPQFADAVATPRVLASYRLTFGASFAAALLNAQPMGFYHPSTIVSEAQRRGVEVRPIDVQRSAWDCTLEPIDDDGRFAVRLGLRMVKGLGNAEAARLVSCREDRPFASVDDLWRRASVPAAALVELAEADARPRLGADQCPGVRPDAEAGRREVGLGEPLLTAGAPRLPFILLPGFIVPLVVATHVAIAARLRAGIRPARLSACPR